MAMENAAVTATSNVYSQRLAGTGQCAHRAGAQRQQQDLQQHHAGQACVAQAQGAQRGQRAELALQVRLHAVEHAQAPDEQRREAHQQQTRTDLPQHLADVVAAFVEAADVGVGHHERGNEIAPRRGGGAAVVQAQAVAILHTAAGLHQPGSGHRGIGHEHRRRAPVGAHAAVRLELHDGAHVQHRIADLDPVAHRQARALRQHRVQRRAPAAVALGQQFAQRAAPAATGASLSRPTSGEFASASGSSTNGARLSALRSMGRSSTLRETAPRARSRASSSALSGWWCQTIRSPPNSARVCD
jgi:hypothetical protein